MDDFDYASLDPGIRDVVRWLHARGIRTSDSGDGKTKFLLTCKHCGYKFGAGDPPFCHLRPTMLCESEIDLSTEAMPFPHVIVPSTPETVIAEARILLGWLRAGRPDEDWVVEASFSPNDGSAFLLMRR